MNEKEQEKFMEAISVSMDLSKLVEDIKIQEKRFLLIDFDDIKDDDKELIKSYRKNLRTLYTKYAKKDRKLAGDIEKDFFEPSPTNIIEDKAQRSKQALFDRLMYLKEKFYKKIIFQFNDTNIDLLRNIQVCLERMVRFNVIASKSVTNVEIPKEQVEEKNDDELLDVMDVIKKGEDIEIPIPDDKINEIFSDDKIDESEEKWLPENPSLKDLELPELEKIPVENEKNIDKENDETVINSKIEETKEEWLSENPSLKDLELPELEKIPVKNDDVREKEIDEIFNFIKKDDEPEKIDSEITDFKINDGNVDYDIENKANELINKISNFEQAFIQLNLNNVTLLSLAIIKEYQDALKKFNTEFSDLERQSVTGKSKSLIYGATPLYFRLGQQNESDKILEEEYNKLQNELNNDVEIFITIDLNKYDEIDFEWMKKFQARLIQVDTFFETDQMQKYI